MALKLERASMAALMIGGLLALLPAVASAHSVSLPGPSPSAAECPAPSLFTALGAFGDSRSYFTAPGGAFEAPSWSLAGGATLTAGSSPLHLGPAKGSLKLPSGSSATSPVFCVDLDYPTLRFFSAQLAPRSKSKLSVEVIYPALGTSKPKATDAASGTPAWTLSKDIKLRPELVTKGTGWRYVQIRFTTDRAITGDWRVDDVLVDPRMRG
jgi:hypothetical protein